MRYQVPNGKLIVGAALDGSIGDFYLCQSGNNIPMDPKLFDKCLINTQFSKDHVDGTDVNNDGSAGPMSLSGGAQYIMRQTTIGSASDTLKLGTLEGELAYDGLACNDGGYLLDFEGTDTGF
jgi:hypothetical protein